MKVQERLRNWGRAYRPSKARSAGCSMIANLMKYYGVDDEEEETKNQCHNTEVNKIDYKDAEIIDDCLRYFRSIDPNSFNIIRDRYIFCISDERFRRKYHTFKRAILSKQEEAELKFQSLLTSLDL